MLSSNDNNQDNNKVVNNNINSNVNVNKQLYYIAVCPECYKKDLTVRTIRKNKSKYYYCSLCRKSTAKPIFLDKNLQKETRICPRCDGDLIRRGVIKNSNKQIYQCCSCSKYTTIPKVFTEQLCSLLKTVCSICEHSKLTKRGFNRRGQQIYYCSKCDKHTINVIKYPINTLLVINE